MEKTNPTDQTSLVNFIIDKNIEPQNAKFMAEKFQGFIDEVKDWREKAESLVVTDVKQRGLMQEARNARLAVKEIRLNADKVRKHLKEASLREGQAIQSVYNLIRDNIAPIEEHLKQQEDFAKIEKAKAAEILRQKRAKELEPFNEYFASTLDLSDMSEEEYQSILSNAKEATAAYEKQEKERIAQEKRLAELEAERVERDKQERIRLEAENKKLQEENAAALALAAAAEKRAENAIRHVPEPLTVSIDNDDDDDVSDLQKDISALKHYFYVIGRHQPTMLSPQGNKCFGEIKQHLSNAFQAMKKLE